MRAVTDGAGAGAGAGLRVASLRFGRACVRACGRAGNAPNTVGALSIVDVTWGGDGRSSQQTG